MPSVRVQTEDFDAGVEIARIRTSTADIANSAKIGALASFIGVCRDVNEGDAVTSMTLEHYPGMTERALGKIVAEAMARWQLIDATVIHRVGNLRPLDQIVLVVVAASHRSEAFAACEFIMDYLKTRAPLWKKEQTAEGARWVEARASDDASAERWSGDQPSATHADAREP